MFKSLIIGATLALSTLTVAAPATARVPSHEAVAHRSKMEQRHIKARTFEALVEVEAEVGPDVLVETSLFPTPSASLFPDSAPVRPIQIPAVTPAAEMPTPDKTKKMGLASAPVQPAPRPAETLTSIQIPVPAPLGGMPGTEPPQVAPSIPAHVPEKPSRGGAKKLPLTPPATPSKPSGLHITPVRLPQPVPALMAPLKKAPGKNKITLSTRWSAGALEGERGIGVKYAPGGDLSGLSFKVERVTKANTPGYPATNFEVGWEDPNAAILSGVALTYTGSGRQIKVSGTLRPWKDERVEIAPFVEYGSGGSGAGIELRSSWSF